LIFIRKIDDDFSYLVDFENKNINIQRL